MARPPKDRIAFALDEYRAMLAWPGQSSNETWRRQRLQQMLGDRYDATKSLRELEDLVQEEVDPGSIARGRAAWGAVKGWGEKQLYNQYQMMRGQLPEDEARLRLQEILGAGYEATRSIDELEALAQARFAPEAAGRPKPAQQPGLPYTPGQRFMWQDPASAPEKPPVKPTANASRVAARAMGTPPPLKENDQPGVGRHGGASPANRGPASRFAAQNAAARVIGTRRPSAISEDRAQSILADEINPFLAEPPSWMGDMPPVQPPASPPPPTGNAPPAAEPPANAWAYAEGLGLRFGLRPEKTADVLAKVGITPTTFSLSRYQEAERALYQQVTPGFQAARSNWQVGQRAAHEGDEDWRESFPSEIAWQRSTAYRKQYFATARPVTRDAMGQAQPAPGWTHRKGTPTEVPYEQRFAAWPAVNAQGEQLTTLDLEKPEGRLKQTKRQQQWGRHELAQLSGLETFTGLPAGPGQEPETFQRSRIFSTLGGAPGPAGTALLSPTVGNVEQQVRFKLFPENGQPLGELVQEGQKFRSGQTVPLAANQVPLQLENWNLDVENVRPYQEADEEGKYREGVIVGGRRWARPDVQLIANKYGGQKGLERLLGAEPDVKMGDQPFSLHEINELKELQGKAQAIFQGEWAYYREPAQRERIAQELGYQDLAQMQAAFPQGPNIAQLGERIFTRFQKYAFERNEQGEVIGPGRYVGPMQYSFPIHKTQIADWQHALTGEPTPLGDDMYQATAEWWGVHSPVENGQMIGEAARYSQEPPGQGRAFLPLRELERLQMAEKQGLRRPGTYAGIMRASARTRADYQSVINAALATTGKFGYEEGVFPTAAPEFRKAALEAQMVATAGVGAESAGAAPSRKVVREWYHQMLKGEYAYAPLRVQTAEGQLFLPPLARLQRFGHEGPQKGAEVSRYLTSAYNLLTGQAAGNLAPGVLERTQRIQRRMAESVNTKRRAIGAEVPRNLGALARGVYNPALPEGTFYQRDLQGWAATIGRSPSTGTGMYGSAGIQRGLTAEEAGPLGIFPGTTAMQMSGQAAGQASGDFDADFYQAVVEGRVQKAEDGYWTVDEKGQKLARIGTEEQFQAMRQAVQENVAAGRGDPLKEIAGRQTLQQAAATVLGTQLRPVPKEQALGAEREAYETYSYISRTYAPDLQMEAFAKGQPQLQRAVGAIGSRWYGTGQVPERLPKVLQNALDIQNLSPGGLIYEQWEERSKKLDTRRRSVYKGALGAMMETVGAYRGLVGTTNPKTGHPYYSAEAAGQMLAPTEESVPQVTTALQQAAAQQAAIQAKYTNAEGQVTDPKALAEDLARVDWQAAQPIIEAAGGMDKGPANWLVSRSPAGKQVGGLIAMRAKRMVGQYEQYPDLASVRQKFQVPDDVWAGMEANYAQMRAHQQLRSKRTPAAEMVEAANREGIPGFVRPIDQATGQVQPIVTSQPAAATSPKRAQAAQQTAAGGVSLPIMVTQRMRQQLGQLGYDTHDVDRMTPEEAHQRIQAHQVKQGTIRLHPQAPANQVADANVRAAIQPGQGPAPSANAPVLRPENQQRPTSPVQQASQRNAQEYGPEEPEWLREEEESLAAAGGVGQPPQPPAAPPTVAPEEDDPNNYRRYQDLRRRYHAARAAGQTVEAEQIYAQMGRLQSPSGRAPRPTPGQALAGNYATGPRGSRVRHGRTISHGTYGGSIDPAAGIPRNVIDEDQANRNMAEMLSQTVVRFRGKGTFKEGFSLYPDFPEMAPWEKTELKKLTAQGGPLEQLQPFMAQMETNPTMVLPRKYEQGMAGIFKNLSGQLSAWAGKQGGAYPAQAADALKQISKTNEILQGRAFEQKIQMPEMPETPKLAFDKDKAQLTDNMKKEVDAFTRHTKAVEEDTENLKKLDKYFKIMKVASPQVSDKFGEIRGGVEAAEAWAQSGKDLRRRDVQAILAGLRHPDPNVRESAGAMKELFEPGGLEAKRGRAGGTWAEVPGRMMSGLESIGWTMFNVNRAWRLTGGAMTGWANQYANEQMLAQQANWNVTGQGGLTGAPLQALQRQARMAYTTSQLGAAVNRIYGPMIDRLSQNFAEAPQGRQDAIVRGLGTAGGLAIGGFISHQAYRMVAPAISALTGGASLAPLAPVALGLGAMSGTAQAVNPYNLNAGLQTGTLSTLINMAGLGPTVAGMQTSARTGVGQAVMRATPFLSGVYQTLGMQPGISPAATANIPKDMQERVKNRAFDRQTTDQEAIVKAMVEQGYTPEETYQLLTAMTGATGEKPTLGEVLDNAQASRMAGTTPAATISRAQGLVSGAGGLPGSKGYGALLQRAIKQPEWKQQQVQAAQGIWGEALMQTNLSPEQRIAVQETWGAKYINEIPAMQQSIGAVQGIFSSRGLNMPVYAPQALEGLRTQMGVSPSQMNYMAQQYNTPFGWSMRQPMTMTAGGGWQAGLYENVGLGLQEYGTSARFGLQARGLARSYQFRMGAPNGDWTAGTDAGQTSKEGWTSFGGGAFTGGIGYGLQGQLSMHQDSLELVKSLRALNETMIKAERGYQQQQAGFALQGANLSYRQGLENIAFQEKQFRVQRAYQVQELGFQQRQMVTQQGWQRQDLSYQQSMAGLQYGWQQEDYTRAIRFATGRERQQLRREMGRAQITYTMEEGQRGRERDRFETQAKWQNQALERQKAYYDQLATLQEEQFAMQRRHLTEQYQLQVTQIRAQIAHLNEMYGLQDQQRKLENDWQDKQGKYQEEQIKKEMELAKLEYADAQAALGLEMELARRRGEYNAEQQKALMPGGELWESWKTLVAQIQLWLDGLTMPDGSGGRSGGGGGGGGDKALGSLQAEGGRTRVGEHGPELVGRLGPEIVNLARGVQVLTAPETAHLAGVLPQPATTTRARTGNTVVHVYLGTQELEQLMVRTVATPAMAGALADNSRRSANRRL